VKEKIDGIEFERSTGNVFADLGLPRPADRLIKSNLTALITNEITQRNLTQSGVGELVGLDQADVSRLLRGRVNRFSIERLFEILNRLGYTVELRITHEDRARHRKYVCQCQPVTSGIGYLCSDPVAFSPIRASWYAHNILPRSSLISHSAT
jgi:predicted XRE-type DNA-binding protein